VNVSTAHFERLEKNKISLNKCASERKRRTHKTMTKKKGTQKERKKKKKKHPRIPSVLPGVFFRNGEREAGWFASLLLLLLLRGGGSFAHFLSQNNNSFSKARKD